MRHDVPDGRERTLGARTIVSISSQAPVDLVSAWVAAFNEHDLDGCSYAPTAALTFAR